MRYAAALSIAAMAVLLVGCAAPAANEELRGTVDGVAPTERSTLGCEWESNYGSGAAPDYYGCSWLASGGIESVGREVLSRAIAHGYRVYCDAGRHRLQLLGSRGENALSVEILSDGFVIANTVSPDDIDIPRGQVYVAIYAANGATSKDVSAPRCVP